MQTFHGTNILSGLI